MLGPVQLIIYTDAKIGMACCNFYCSAVHIICHQQGIPLMCNMCDVAFINAKFHFQLGFLVTKSVYVLL